VLRKPRLLIMLTMLLLCTFTAPALSADSTSISDALQEIVSYYSENRTELDNWEEITGLKTAGVDLTDDCWQLPDWGIDSLDVYSPTSDYATTILGMLAADQNPASIDNRNLVEELASKQGADGSFGVTITDTIWAMLTLDKAQGTYNTEQAVNSLLNQQLDDGGFAFSGKNADPDITGFTLMALSVYRDISGVNEAIEGAILCLQELQLESGGFSSWGTENTETIAAVIRGLIACGEDITADPWVKEGRTMIDALFAFQLADKSFSHSLNGNHSDIATRQALNAVADLVAANISYQIDRGDQSGGDNSGMAEVRVRVEGASASLADEIVNVDGTALDALKAAVGEENIQFNSYGMVGTILGESGLSGFSEGIDTSWMYYVIRDGSIDGDAFSHGADSYNVKDGDEVIFYIAAFDNTTWESRTYFPVVSVNPAQPSAEQSVTLTITAKNYNFLSGLEDLDADTVTAIDSYTVTVGTTDYTTFYGQVVIPDVTEGDLNYTIRNANPAGYADTVTYKGSIPIQAAVSCQVRLRVEGATASLADETVNVYGTALDALKAAVGEGNVQLDNYGMVGTILGESGQSGVSEGISTSWMYYVIRDGSIDTAAFSQGADSYNVKDGDEVIFFIGAYDEYYNPKTYFTVITISPSQPAPGENIKLSITAHKNDWGQLSPLSDEETAAIGTYVVKAGGNEYISNDGSVTILNVAAGTLEYIVSNSNPANYPDTVTYKGSITINNPTGGSPTIDNSISIYIAIAGKDSNLLYKPGSVRISPNSKYGLTAMSALDATGLSYELSNRNDGMVVSIAGQKNEGLNGWCGKVNSTPFWDVPKEIPVEAGDRIIFWYSLNADFEGPDWDDVLSGHIVQTSDALTDATKEQIKQTLLGYAQDLNKLSANLDSGTNTGFLKVLNADKRMNTNDIAALKNELANHKVALSETAGKTETVIGDTEIAILIPENALSDNVAISVTEVQTTEQTTPSGIKIGSSIYEFGPDGTKFDRPVTISLKVPLSQDMDINNIAPAWYDKEQQQWIKIPGIIDLKTGLVVFRIDHFTKFALIEAIPAQTTAVITVPARISFSDIKADLAWAKDAIEILAGRGILKGTGQGMFEPQRPISRSEFVKLMASALELKPVAYQGLFNDVHSSDWFAQAVATAYNNKIVSGYPDGSFKPDKSISRNEIASILYQIEGAKASLETLKPEYNDLAQVPIWALEGVIFATQKGLMSGYTDNTFRGQNPLTRAEAAVIVYKYLNSMNRHS
jgi:hypothetical protein